MLLNWLFYHQCQNHNVVTENVFIRWFIIFLCYNIYNSIKTWRTEKNVNGAAEYNRFSHRIYLYKKVEEEKKKNYEGYEWIERTNERTNCMNEWKSVECVENNEISSTIFMPFIKGYMVLERKNKYVAFIREKVTKYTSKL